MVSTRAQTDELLELEREGWVALSSPGEAAAQFYEGVLAPEVQILMPGGTVINDRAQVVASMDGPPWQSYELDDERVIPLTEDSAVVTYRATAERDDTTYTALIASTYARIEGDWKLVVHQQTPV